MRKILIILSLSLGLLWAGNGTSGGVGLIKIIKDEVKKLDEKVAEIKEVTTPPSAPSDLEAQAVSSSQINLSWSDNSDDETGFTIERRTETETWRKIGVVGTNKTIYSDTGLSASTTYSYRLYAYNSAGKSSYSNEDNTTTHQEATTPPSAPSDLQARAVSSSRIDLSWIDNSDNETDFIIERRIETGTWGEINSVGADETAYKDVGLTAKTLYCYRVKAHNSAGDSDYSEEIWKTTLPREQAGTVRWKFPTDGKIGSSPAIGADGTIYVGSEDKNLYAINPDGEVRWKFPTDGKIGSSPAIGADGTIYVGSEDKNLYAINPDGEVRWKFPTDGKIGSSPAIGADGTIYVGSEDKNLYAIDSTNGEKKWEFPTGFYIYSSPAIGTDKTIYIGSLDNKLYAIKPDKTKKWDFLTGLYIYSSPAIGTDGTIYIGSLDYKLYAINPANGEWIWKFQTGGRIGSSPAIGIDGTIYVGSEDNNLYAINPANGAMIWKSPTYGGIGSSPAIGTDGTIYVGSEDGCLYAINPANGAMIWKSLTYGGIGSSPAIGTDGTIYVGSEDGKLYAIYSSGSLADTPWPMFRCNLQHTGRNMK